MKTDSVTVRFPIGAKLIILISIIVIVSLGSITALVSWINTGNLQVSAEENNFEINRRFAVEAEMHLINIHSNSRMLMQVLTTAGAGSALARETVNFFFNENPEIASVFYITPGRSPQVLHNRQFLVKQETEAEFIDAYFHTQRSAIGRAVRGETVLVNAAPYFTRPFMALFFPWRGGGVAAALFSFENFNQNLGFSLNQSYMINSDGDILSYADFSLVQAGINLSEENYIRSILDSPHKSRQELVKSDFKLLQTKDELAGTGKQKITRQFVSFTRLNIAGAVMITGIEYDKVFEELGAAARRNIYLTISVLSISIILIWFFSKTISIPLKALAVVARNIEGGSFDMPLEAKSGDEIGVLTGSFQKMCSALHIFGRFTNKEIAVKAMRGEIKPGGLPKNATIFFSDIRDFTAKSENFTNVFGEDASNRIVHWLNRYFTGMVDCVEKTNGVVDKFIGDAVMAHWGTAYTAGSPEKDAFNCVNAALMMRKILYDMNKARDPADHSDPPIMIGCGINTGIVTAGQLGSDMRMEYTVIGDPVNLASRIEALTKPLGADILISEETWRLTGDKFITEEMPPVTVKGKEKSVRIFAVVNFKDIDSGPKTLSDVRKLLGIQTPDNSKVNVNADEKKYKIGGTNGNN
ncbi:MAG: adenylate/guanylate cyclase domain-containing protein [Treponema sp.]|jgi:adenylate cyclase|nr:adenylate/guanylate cyclase domain-containing protein [Treponema sp.]